MKFPKFFSQSNLSATPEPNSEAVTISIDGTKSLTKQIPTWRFVLPFALQLALILSVPAEAIYTHIAGKTVVLQTAPVDPYDFLRGYYQVLSYDISQQDNLKKLPGWSQFELETSGRFTSETNIYVILAAPETEENLAVPKVWKPVGVSAKLPENLPENQIAIKGKSDGWQIQYGLETYYMPEDQREAVNQDIQQAQSSLNSENKIPFVVEVKVNSQGKAVPVSLWVRDRNYKF